MSFRKGDKVEVMYQKEIPVSWCVGEILSGNDHTYRLKYDYYPGTCSNKMVETVSRKFIRPCPIMVQGVESCIPGDIVEVFHDFSWKLASIVKVLKDSKEINVRKKHFKNAIVKRQYVVRLLGCLQELLVDKSIVRMRQIWHDDKWIIIGRKNSQSIEDGPACKTSISNNYQKSNDQITPMNAWLSTKRQKCDSNSFIQAHNRGVQKSRVVQKYDRIHKVISTPSDEKVLGKRKMGNFTSEGDNRSSEPYHSNSDECSVGSCSVMDQSPKNRNNNALITAHYRDMLSSDAESCYGSGFDGRISCLGPSEEEVEVGVRRLEVQAYRSTLEALYASGPLSWEQEAMLTNLRIVLRISNDEHSMELKHLIKSAVAVR